ncbi:N-glycosylase/DNA lyase [Natronoarchaeum philippinense]|uniref:DNA-(apurinic or apyrimidinic site) lyase n=1 Tax=Natronoarchaeum philippinense TaxID=558529 RepID=A0A285N511_NATPI|nr:DNA glycosylase [Natronoarchaeum philippinense]SNZ02811.1 N-glycosylase/DNA lyase [Natronoarchaeum philippinense]
MPTGSIPIDTLPGGIDLYATLESGQSYLWRREDGRMYEDAPDGQPWYCTVIGGETLRDSDGTSGQRPRDAEALRVRQTDEAIEWESTTDAETAVRTLLRLDDDLPEIFESAPDDDLVEASYDYARGLRLVDDPPFPTLIAFICSQQMRVARIHSMVSTLAREYGDAVEFRDRTYHAFPTPDQLAAATESELRELGLGYRAPYVVRTAEMVASGEAHPRDAAGLPYEDAREELTRFVGVGDKVADCILLFSLGYLEAVPLDTWIKTAVEEYYPECDRGNYRETSRAIRSAFGVETDGASDTGRDDAYAGYVQTYVFHYLRTRDAAE